MEQQAIGLERSDRMFTDGQGAAIHPHAISQAFERISHRAGVRVIRLHGVRHTHASLLIAAGVPVKVVSERLGHASPTFTIETYQHVLPGMQADAAKLFEHLIARDAVLPAAHSPVESRKKPRKKTA
ncbi:MAG: tyrosine-type recombinase/integrase [Acidimicrobiia bacterium]